MFPALADGMEVVRRRGNYVRLDDAKGFGLERSILAQNNGSVEINSGLSAYLGWGLFMENPIRTVLTETSQKGRSLCLDGREKCEGLIASVKKIEGPGL
jgi:hypothetical protein